MKKIFILLLILSIAVCAWFYFARVSISHTPQTIEKTNQFTAMLSGTNPMVATNTLTSSPAVSKPINAITATNLAQWKALIPGLKYSGNFIRFSSWIMETVGRTNGIPVTFSLNGETVRYKAIFVNVSAKNGSDDVLEVALQTANMNIDDTRQLGLQLCDMMQVDSKGFTDWCDKVGNHWVDAPLFEGAGNKQTAFHIIRGYNDEKPWCIEFLIQNP